MKPSEAIARLKSAGTEQNRKVYARHRVGRKMYGVSMAELKKLRREIGTDHDLALRLWDTGNHDARMLAALVADPTVISSGMLDAWSWDLNNYVVTNSRPTGFATL